MAVRTTGQSNLESVFLKFAKVGRVSQGHIFPSGPTTMSSSRAPPPPPPAPPPQLTNPNYLDGDDEEQDHGSGDGESKDNDEAHLGTSMDLWENSKSRLVLSGPSKTVPCLFGRCGGFHPKLKEQEWFSTVPARLAQRGVTQEEWDVQMELLAKVQGKAKACDPMRGFICFSICLTILAASLGQLWHCCPWSKCDPFQTALRNWLHDFNVLLEPKGIFVKGFCFGQRTEKDGKVMATTGDDHALPVLVFGLTKKEIRRMKNEEARLLADLRRIVALRYPF